MWGDDGGYCEYDSALAGLAWAAEQAYGSEDADALRDRFEAICGVGYEDVLLGSKLHDQTLGNRIDETPVDLPVQVLWDDPLLGMHHLTMKARKPEFWKLASAHYHQVAYELAPHIGRTQPIDLDHALTLAKFLAAKVDFRDRARGGVPGEGPRPNADAAAGGRPDRRADRAVAGNVPAAVVSQEQAVRLRGDPGAAGGAARAVPRGGPAAVGVDAPAAGYDSGTGEGLAMPKEDLANLWVQRQLQGDWRRRHRSCKAGVFAAEWLDAGSGAMAVCRCRTMVVRSLWGSSCRAPLDMGEPVKPYSIYAAADSDAKKIVEDWGSLNWLASQKLGNAEGVTIGRVVIKKGCCNPRHIHNNCEEVLYLLAGKLEHTMGDKKVILNAGDTLTVAAGVPHNAVSIGEVDADMIVAYSSGVRDFVLEEK